MSQDDVTVYFVVFLALACMASKTAVRVAGVIGMVALAVALLAFNGGVR